MATGKAAKPKDEAPAAKLITPVGIVCFPHVWEPHVWKDEKGDSDKEPAYSLILVFDEDADFTELRRACGKALIAKWGEAKAKAMKAQFKLPFRDASDYAEYGFPFDDGERKMIIIKSRTAPGIVDARAKPIMNQMDFYAGCLARASVYPHAYDTRGNKGVTFLLNNLQKAGDGEKLSGRGNAEDDFEALENGGGASDASDLF